jgi:hypothetical protein
MSSDPAKTSPELPLEYECPPQQGPRNRLTVFLRPLLALPHVILVGAPPLATASVSFSGLELGDAHTGIEFGGTAGVLGAVAGICAVIAWFAILFAGRHPDGLWGLGHLYLRWRARALTYMLLLRDEYPPFGDEPYPIAFALERPEGPRDRVRVGLRIFLLIPYALVLVLLSVAMMVVTVIAWLSMLFTGELSAGLHGFIARFIRWDLSLEAFFLLLRDEFPAFLPRD